jgi:hypothetical protein
MTSVGIPTVVAVQTPRAGKLNQSRIEGSENLSKHSCAISLEQNLFQKGEVYC